MTFSVSNSEKLNLLGRDYFVVYIDLDGVKSINDNKGHASGGQPLVLVTELSTDKRGKTTTAF